MVISHNDVQIRFDKILSLQEQKKRTMHKIQAMSYRKVGRIHIKISNEEKADIIKRIDAAYKKRIQDIYKDLEAYGIKNPYE